MKRIEIVFTIKVFIQKRFTAKAPFDRLGGVGSVQSALKLFSSFENEIHFAIV